MDDPQVEILRKPAESLPVPARGTGPDVIAQLKLVIVDDLKLGIDPERIHADTPLLEGGLGLDSITLFEFITLVEKRFGIVFPVNNLSTETFANVHAVAQQVEACLSPVAKEGAV